MDEIFNRNYVRNTPTSRERTVRIELVGDFSESERNFLNGISYFVAGTFSKDDDRHTRFVSGLMSDLVKEVIRKMRKEIGGQ